MNKYQTVLALVVSAVVGVLSVVYATQTLRAENIPPTQTVVIAKQDIPAGAKLSGDLMTTVEWPESAKFNGIVHSIAELDDRVTANAVTSGEPILLHRLAPEGTRSGLSGQISPGKRAFTIKVNEVVGVAGFAIPGTYVDVLVTLREPNNASVNRYPGPRSQIVLERILVLAAAQEHSINDEHRPKIVGAVTLEVTPQEAEKLDLARAVGTLSLALRNAADLGSSVQAGAVLEDIFPAQSGLQSTAQKSSNTASRKPAAKVLSVQRVEVYRGLNRSSLELI